MLPCPRPSWESHRIHRPVPVWTIGIFAAAIVLFFAGDHTLAPAAQATELAAAATELKKDGDVYSGDLTEEGAKAQFRFGTVSNPKGWVKFWVKDGALTKFEFKVTGKVDFNGNEFDMDRTSTVEVKEVGTTKVSVPEEAKKKLS